MNTGLPLSDIWNRCLLWETLSYIVLWAAKGRELIITCWSLVSGVLRNVQGSLLSAVVSLMLCSQTTTRSAWLQKYLSTKDIFQTLLWGVEGTWLTKGLWGRAVYIRDHCQVCQTWQITPSIDTQDIPLKVRYLRRCPCLLGTVGDRANGHWCTWELHGYEARTAALSLEAGIRGWTYDRIIFSLFPHASIMDTSGTSKTEKQLLVCLVLPFSGENTVDRDFSLRSRCGTLMSGLVGECLQFPRNQHASFPPVLFSNYLC